MLEDINFTESESGEIRVKIKSGGATVAYPITELMAVVLLRQLGGIVSARFEKENREQHGHVVEPPLPEASEAKEVGGA